MYKVKPEILKLCKETALLLRDFIVDEMQRDPSRKKELSKELKKAEKVINDLNEYPL